MRIIVNEGKGPRPHELDRDRLTIGATPDCDVVLHEPSAAGAQMVLERTPTGHRLVALTGAVLVNEEPIDVAHLLHNDTVRVGEVLVLYKNPEATRPAVEPDVAAAAATDLGQLDDSDVLEEADELEDFDDLEELGELIELEEIEELPAPVAPPEAEDIEELDALDDVEELEFDEHDDDEHVAWEELPRAGDRAAPWSPEPPIRDEPSGAGSSGAEPSGGGPSGAEERADRGEPSGRGAPAARAPATSGSSAVRPLKLLGATASRRAAEAAAGAEPEAAAGAGAEAETPRGERGAGRSDDAGERGEAGSAPSRRDGGDRPDRDDPTREEEASAPPAPRRERRAAVSGVVRFTRPLPPGHRPPAGPPPAHPGRPPAGASRSGPAP